MPRGAMDGGELHAGVLQSEAVSVEIAVMGPQFTFRVYLLHTWLLLMVLQHCSY